ALAAPRFAHERDRGSRRDVERDALHGVERLGLPLEAEADVEALDAEQRFGGHLRFGSSGARRGSGGWGKAVQGIALEAPAAASCHHLPITSSFCASASIVPHDTWSTGTPKPRKERITSALMNCTVCCESCTSETWLTLGRMWTNMRRELEAPIACAAF